MEISPRLGLPIVDGTDSIYDYPAITGSADALLDAVATRLQGTLAALPSPSIAGRRYYATDKKLELMDTGTHWLPVGTTNPIGMTMHYAGAIDPQDADGVARWLICDGRAIGRTTYSGLFAVVGTTYGTGNGSTTFNIPDGRGRVIVGAGTGSGLTTRALGSNGGEENHLLTTAEIPAHTHTATESGSTGTESAFHHHSSGDLDFVTAGGAVSGKAIPLQGGGTGGQAAGTDVENQSHTHAISSSPTISTVGGQAHNNMMRFVVLNHIIKVL